MPISKSTISYQTYTAFKNIPKRAWSEIIQFYERNEENLYHLSEPKRLDMLHVYLEALYEIQDSKRVVDVSPEMISAALAEEIPIEQGRQYYEDALFWKAASLIRLMEYKESSYILKELVKMNPKDKRYSNHLFFSLFFNKPRWIQISKAVSILFFLVAAIVALFEILIVGTFYKEYLEMVQWLRTAIFFIALGLVLTMELIHGFKCWMQLNHKF